MTTRPGMTLIEVVVALVVAGTALAAGYAALGGIVDHSARADEMAGAAVHAATLRQTLAQWLTGTRLSYAEAGPAFEGLDGEHEGVPDDVIVFLTTAPTPLPTREAVVALYIDRDAATPERGLVAALMPWQGTALPSAVAPRTTAAGTVTASVQRIELVPDATGLDIRYRSGLLDDARWLPSWISSSVAPAAIELRITAAEPALLPPLLRLPVRVPVRSAR